MPQYSPRSQEKLSTCHANLQKVFNEVIKHYDHVVVCGIRTEAEQEEAYETGHSKLGPGHSKHETTPLSMAVDVAPCAEKGTIDWNDREAFYHFAGFALGIATSLGINLRWGGNWAGDNKLHDQTFFDLGHFEIT